MNFQPFDLLPRFSSIPPNNHQIWSTQNTFIETPPNFDINDYRLNESSKITEKVIFKEISLIFYLFNSIFFKEIHEESNNIYSIDKQISQYFCLIFDCFNKYFRLFKDYG